jgi:hypothetical protein
MALTLGAIPATAQSPDDLNIQIHGYATQGFLYTNVNNILTTNSSSGSPAWTEAVVNVSAQPTPKLRVGVQARYFLLGNIGNAITLDWGQADYKVNDKFGVRFGKVKTPTGLYNDVQDIDPSYMWSLLPQGVYPILSRNSLLAIYGGVAYGTIGLGPNLGKLEYRAFGGERVLASDDGFFLAQREAGLVMPNGLSQVNVGGALHWRTPLQGLEIGASDFAALHATSVLIAGPYTGIQDVQRFNFPDYFGRYERGKVLFVGEWTRIDPAPSFVLQGLPSMIHRLDQRSWYGMASYKVTNKLTIGGYDSQSVDHQAALGPARHSLDWTASGRYDFNEFLYAKAEQHFIVGNLVGFDANVNPGGLKPNTKLTILKVGVSF